MTKLLSLLLCLFIVTPTLMTSKVAAPSDEEEVRKTVMGMAAAWNRHDMDAFGNLLAPDADYVNVAGMWTKGRRTIKVNHEYLHGTIPADTPGVHLPVTRYGVFKTTTIHPIQIDVRFLRKDVAVAHESWEMLDSRSPNTRRGLAIFVLIRENGAWLVAVAQDTEIAHP